ncbi:D-alanine--D-alanyl carrier protein ligase [Seminavis robusta]|uniref:D-alanine--D-alanyl carrier protein ligase n=1 Tax=Seminavis robusta TaxID=568900 RepID=A0A9N8H4G0_9STRA|nr:D-alanine--D-alanyl carrier protein ligase [Seminavis robusta]|eukprot:Sro113_g056020.1 D-alanine--D-alanyl carrier protein ligase (1365) ;mRNA; f:45974-50144
MKSYSTILEALSHHAKETPEKKLFTWVDIKCKEQKTLTFHQLEVQSNAVAHHLIKLGCQKGDRVMVAYPFGLEFLAGMLGAMKIGVIPCSTYPPNPNQLKTEMPKFRGFVEDAGAKFALTTTAFATGMAAAGVLYKSGVKWIGTDKLMVKKNKANVFEMNKRELDDACFVQYTSGSTGQPKGVMISHHNLAENCRAIQNFNNLKPSSVGALWLPQYHDMGLVGGFMAGVYVGHHVIMTSPLDFIAKPLLWSDMVETYQATHVCAPNFAYALLLKRLEQANRKANWSCIEIAMFGAEPTQSHVVKAVAETLSIKQENVCNLYGLAEAVLFLTGGTANPDSEGLVCCGEVDSPTLKLRIIEDGKEVEEGQVGSIWAQSPRVAAGYFGKPEQSKITFANTVPGYDGTWLDTGDLGKVVGGQLYVTGRVKDVIIINGKNYYPTDVEHSINATFGDIIRPGRTTVFQHGDASVGITAETRKDTSKSSNGDFAVLLANHVSQVHGLSVSEVVVLKAGVTPKTTSGKLKRSEIRQTTISGDWKSTSIVLRSDFRGNAVMIESTKTRIPGPSSVVNCKSSHGEKHVNPEKPCSNMVGNQSVGKEGSKQDLSCVLLSVLGTNLDAPKTWAENGLTSLKSAELRMKIEEGLHVSLPPNFEQLYPTPEALEIFLAASKGQRFPTQEVCNHPDFIWNPSRSMCSKLQLGVAQILGSILILSLLLLAFVPSYFLGSFVMGHCDSAGTGACNGPMFWMVLPLLFPLFILSFSLLVVLCKLSVVGSYQPQQMELLSWRYIRWWFVDRLLEIWESLVGNFVLETKFIWVFYWLLGVDMAWSSKIEAYIREFDLVKVGENAVIGHSLKCRKFSQRPEGSPQLTFRPIVVGSNCHVSGMLSPGATIGDGSKVERLTAVAEGAMVPNGVLARGVPAYHAGHHEQPEPTRKEDFILDAFKIVWTMLEAYYFFALSYLVHTFLVHVLPPWQYVTILYWLLLLPGSSFLAIVSSIALKWVLIGKRDPSDQYEGSLWHKTTNWACDFHFQCATWALTPFFGQSKLWNIILFLHGLDVDMASNLNIPYLVFPPSKVDFVKIRNSFASTISLDLNYKSDSKIEIINSSIGYHANLRAGVKVLQSTVPSRTNVTDSIYDLNQTKPNLNPTIFMNILLPELSQLLLNIILFVTIIPTYEFCDAFFTSSSAGVAGCCLAAAVVLQFSLWLLFTRAVEWVMMRLPRNVQHGFFAVYINHAWIFRGGNWLDLLLHGTPLFPCYARMMGAEVDGELWYFGYAIYEFSRMHFQGNTVVDSASLNGHYVDGKGLTIDDTYVSGVVHPGCFAVAGSVISGEENGPWKVFLKSQDIPRYPQPTRSEITFEDLESVLYDA